MKKLLFLLLLLLLFTGCTAEAEAPEFLLGMDTSCVPALEAGGVRYYGFDGTEQDVFRILSENGLNTVRVRVWNHPFDAAGRGYGGGNCDLNNAIAIGQRATRYGMGLLVDFHYSDFWADPGKQQAPKAWKGLSFQEKADALYAYTRDSLRALKDAGVRVTMVQVGNETTGGLCGETDWARITALMNRGAQAVREVFPQAMVAVHFTNPEKPGAYPWFAKTLAEHEVDYDVFATSYYPYWHGTLENLTQVLTQLHETYGKQTLIVETSYAYTTRDTDFHGNTISTGSYSVAGQAAQLQTMLDTAAAIPGCLGLCYWEGTWIAAGGDTWEENKALWERWGSGWAASYAAEYDPRDAGQWHGGCAVDNQALFDETGHPLESLRTFARFSEQGGREGS